MDVFKINDFDAFPLIEPGGIKRSPRFVYGQNAGTTKDGKAYIDRIATKIDYEIKFRPMSEQEMGALLSEIAAEYFTVTLTDPVYGGRTFEAYCDNSGATQFLRRAEAEYWWNGISISIKER